MSALSGDQREVTGQVLSPDPDGQDGSDELENASTSLTQDENSPINEDTKKFIQTLMNCPHHNKDYEIYCKTHSAICCPLCRQIDHMVCDVTFLPKQAAEFSSSEAYSSFKDSLTDKQEKFTILKSQREREKNTGRRIMDEIHNIRCELNARLDALEQEMKVRSSEACDESASFIQTNIEECDKTLADIETAKETLFCLEESKQQVPLFIQTVQMNNTVQKWEIKSDMLYGTAPAYNPNFKPNSVLMDVFNTCQTFGETMVSAVAPIKFVEGIFATTTVGEKNPDITGIRCLSDGNIVAADWNNGCLKLYDVNYNFLSQVVLQDRPFDVCQVGHSTIATTLPNIKSVALITIEASNDMKIEKTFKVNFDCRGIEAYRDTLYIVRHNYWSTGIALYDLTGHCWKTIRKDDDNAYILIEPWYIHIDPIGQKVYVTDSRKGIVAMTTDCNILKAENWMPKGNTGQELCGITFGKTCQDFFVCEPSTNSVVQFKQPGTRVGVLLTEADGICKPRALTFDCGQNRLILSMEKCNTLKVYQFE